MTAVDTDKRTQKCFAFSDHAAKSPKACVVRKERALVTNSLHCISVSSRAGNAELTF
jgi:hypothetical protein